MLPLQIKLEGFMSYRDATTLSFEGASLWMLSGANGVGKSTVFDAMRWTLFGRHRGGAQGQEALIHHDTTKLRVAFDLGLGDDQFRLIRTLSRAGRSTWQIEKLVEGQTEKVPETDMKEGYERWLREHIGLSDETFCAAMYLAQGRGDAILSARPEERHEMLAEIVDLSAYAQLHEQARSRASQAETESRVAKLQWENAPAVEGVELDEARQRLMGVSAQFERDSAQRQELTALLPWAAHWQTLEAERHQTGAQLEAARQLLHDAPQIERDLARLEELTQILPPLESALAVRHRLESNEEQAGKTRADLKVALEKSQTASLALEAAKAALSQSETERQNQLDQRLDLASQLGEMAPALNQANYFENWRSEIAVLQSRLEAFAPDLEAKQTELEARVVQSQSDAITLAILIRYEREFQALTKLRSNEENAAQRVLNANAALATLQREAEDLETVWAQHRQEQERYHTALIAAQTRHTEAQAARARFETVKDDANCHFCGQRLTEEHAAQESERLQSALEKAGLDLAQARSQAQAAKSEAARAEQEVKAAQNSLLQQKAEGERAQIELENAVAGIQNTQIRIAQTLSELSPALSKRFAAKPPSAEEMATLTESAQHLESWRREQKQGLQDLTQQREVAARLADRQAQIAPLATQFTPESVARLRADEMALRKSLGAIEAALKASESASLTAQKNLKNAEKRGDLERQIAAQLETALAALEATRIEIERALQSALAAVPHSLRELLSGDSDKINTQVTAWNAEKAALENGDLRARAGELELARQRVVVLEGEVAQLEKSLRKVPVTARCAPEELQTQSEALRLALEDMESQRGALQLQISQWEHQQAEKKRLESAMLLAQNSARQSRTLAELLGPHQLQRYLLREAENGIVDEANAVLDRISSGTLRLELRAEDDEIAGARKGAPKVLDVGIFRSDGEGVGQGMLPAFLSGSQRFRVSVALALGIGRYATRGGGTRLESVIIDEGFGSLDKIGRGEMIDELKTLGEELKRVILVSHQEEFSEAFPNRYLIEHEDGTSKAHLMAS
jgi:DNA repair exonuclease SbcCD ATPase subunit